jgi:hypothetical protein
MHTKYAATSKHTSQRTTRNNKTKQIRMQCHKGERAPHLTLYYPKRNAKKEESLCH